MNYHALGIVIGVLTAAALALGPWMFMVHAKLAVLEVKLSELAENHVAELTRKLDKLLKICADHTAAIDELRRRMDAELLP